MKKIFCIVISILTVQILSFSQNPQEGWSFNYPNDNFTDESLLDLRYLNEPQAGENGFIRLSDDGESFVNDAGEIRFWAIGGGELIRGHDPNLTSSDLARYARFMSKMGVNMMRYHGELASRNNDLNTPWESEIQNIWKVVNAMKEEGIYSTISPFWPAHIQEIPGSWGLGDYVGDIDPWALIYFDSTFRNAYKNWITDLYTTVDPASGMALKDNPAVGIIQIINEDGVFFWTINGIQPSLMNMIQKQFYAWSVSEYGTINAALNSWQNTSLTEDDIASGKLEIINIWYTTDDPNVPAATPGFDNRLSDQMKFFAETQRAVYQELYDHYRNIGCKQLINASNWRTASPGRLLDLERWTATSTEVMAMNRYFDPGHFGPNSGWRIEVGHNYQGRSAMYNPHLLPINIKQVVGHPFLMTESAWNLPNIHQAEGPFLIAAYQSLTGFDGYYWFSPSSTTYEDDPYWPYFGKINGEEPMYRWTVSIPGQLAMFPANALMYRLGYIQKGDPVVSESRSFTSLVKRNLPVITEETSFDPNRDEYQPNPASGETQLSPLTYLTGPVKIEYSDEDEVEISEKLAQLVNFSEKEITSITGELFWDYKQGICLLNSPQAQGLCGFPQKDQVYNFEDIQITSENDYVVVNVVSMDQQPLGKSQQILVQVGTTYRPTNWRETATTFSPNNSGDEIEGYQIESLGRMPWKASNSKVECLFKDIKITKATLLDAAGYPVEEIAIEIDGQNSLIKLPENAMYLILEADPVTSINLAGLQKKIKIYPNPANNTFSISWPNKLEENELKRIEIINLEGKVLKELPYNRIVNFSFQKGTYLIRITNNDGASVSKKIVIQ